MKLLKLSALVIALSTPALALAQGFQIGFGSLQQDTDLPVEISADALSLNQTDGTAQFKGNVVIIQGTMRMSAPLVTVFYDETTGGIARLEAAERVLLVKDGDAAEADTADYDIDGGTVVMTGDVLLTQGNNTMSSNKLTADLEKGTAQLEGRVKTVMKAGEN